MKGISAVNSNSGFRKKTTINRNIMSLRAMQEISILLKQVIVSVNAQKKIKQLEILTHS